MAFTLLLVLATCVDAQLNIIPADDPEICLLYADDLQNEATEYTGNFSQIFETYNSVTLSFTKYSKDNYDVISILSQYDYSACDILAIDVIYPDMDFNVFLQSENNCSKYSGNKVHYIQLPRDKEYFVYSKNLKFCPLSDSLIGMFCDTQVHLTYFNVSKNTQYDVTDIPEFTSKGYTFYSQEPFYVCQRVSENPWVNVHLFYRSNAPSGVISRQINWGNVWTNIKTFAQIVYKVLDIFFNNKRSVEPRA
uniref:Outer capsid glycoprotein VP7 n=1 Tax=Porcine rotavirus B TaxID=449582 RepID=A0A2R4LGK5_9REOV|nr:VP7 [Porcine rotavirus B]